MFFRDRRESLLERDAALVAYSREVIRRSYDLLTDSYARVRVPPATQRPPEHDNTGAVSDSVDRASREPDGL